MKNKKPDEVIKKTAKICKKRGIIIPTFKQMQKPELIPTEIKSKLKNIKLWDINPLNLFRINWHNEPKTGEFSKVNYIEFLPELTHTNAKIIALIGKYFPTGAHKVGAAFGCLVPKLVSGDFDPLFHKAVWPSTGNYCRGGAFDSALLGCKSIAILPQGMSKERFEWLKKIGSQIIATPGTESNVKEIYDKCWELKKTRDDIMIFNQFEEFGNSMWHYHVTGKAIEEVFSYIKQQKSQLSVFVSSTGSAGTIAAGDYLKKVFPSMKIAACEALQCPTLLLNGFGEHRIEGIGDKHIPWIHNVRNTDVIIAINDEACIRIMRLFNEEEGKKFLIKTGLKEEFVEKLNLIGISGISNLIGSIKVAKYFELGKNDIVITVLTDSMELYKSRIEELRKEKGKYTERDAINDYAEFIKSISTDWMKELTYYDKKAIHNLKYFTWVEQQGKTTQELNKLWDLEFWDKTYSMVDEWDKKIEEFNKIVEES